MFKIIKIDYYPGMMTM